MLKNYKIFFVSAVICAIVAALVGGYGFNTIAKMVPAIVTAQNINADEMPTSRTVTMGKVPAGSMQADTVTDYNQLVGMVAKGFIPAGTPLRKSMFQPITGAGLAARLGTLGDNLVAIAVDPSINTSVGNALKRGDKVTVKAAGKDSDPESISENAPVLDVPDNKTGITAILLAVPIDEADKISTAKINGLTVWCELMPPEK